ncbi:MAG: formate dehydrogenase subunit gamma [Pseudomonadota bacterium]
MLTDSDSEFISQVLALNKGVPGALLPILHGIQDLIGYIPAEAVDSIARELNLSRAEVHGVITYYHHFRSEPAGKHVVQICRAEACQSMGGEALWNHACLKLAATNGHGTSADGTVTLEPVYCLGLCASSPAMAINDRVHARVNAQRFDSLLGRARSAA